METNTHTGPDSNDLGSTGNDERVLAKIKKDHEKVLIEAKDTLQKHPEEIKQDILNDKNKVIKDSAAQGGEDANSLPFVKYHQPPGATGHEPRDPESRARREKVKEVSVCWARGPLGPPRGEKRVAPAGRGESRDILLSFHPAARF